MLRFDLSTNKIFDDSVIIAGSGIDIATTLASVLSIDDIDEFGTGLDEMYGEVCQNTVSILPGIADALEDLSDMGNYLGIATNDAEANAIAQMEALDLDHLFEGVHGADSGFGPKPGSGMVDAFVDILELSPDQVLMVGDSLHDLEAGRAAGVKTCGVETGPAKREELTTKADFVLPSVTELPKFLSAF